MRIQHNIPAMNSYTRYSNNTSAVSKNLEKLSSGYKINRAGDDAAGLAISQKMRIQITGLEQAQSNAKAGINLVQTAEGALTEVHDMLNRMYTLAEQSANGTYDVSTDRAQLQKEVNSLRTEIDRIADSSNYNGIKLLDGSLQQGGSVGVEVVGNVKVSTAAGSASSATVATGLTSASFGTGLQIGGQLEISLTDSNGNSYTATLTKTANNELVDSKTGAVYSCAKAEATAADILKSVVTSMTNGAYKASGTASSSMTIKSVAKGAGAGQITSMGVVVRTANGTGTVKTTSVSNAVEAQAAKKTLSGASVVTAQSTTDTAKNAIFTINGQKFVLTSAKSAASLAAVREAVGSDVTLLLGSNLASVAGQLAQATGLKVTAGTSSAVIDTGSGRALTMQIGDTAESFNRMDVDVKDCHSKAMGIAGIDISTQSGAAAAMTAIKSATNYVSDVRGTLGALQNRLDHTINNLAVSQENIQDAESTIRDTDVAKEMMAYTKNSILVQSAQAMLAQANQLPQGVLQLLG